jgi:hypothetical protein
MHTPDKHNTCKDTAAEHKGRYLCTLVVQVSAASELYVECWDIASGASPRRRDKRRHRDIDAVLARSRFLGLVHVPLATTMPEAPEYSGGGGGDHDYRGDGGGGVDTGASGRSCGDSNEAAVVKRAYTLARRDGRDMVSGAVVLAFQWSITAAGLLRQKCIALEKVLLQRNEILAMLNPRTAAEARLLWHTESGSGGGDETAHSGEHRSTTDGSQDESAPASA